MDVNSIEATSVAIRAGQVAAAELCNLLTHEEDEPLVPIEDWFDPHPAQQGPAEELARLLGEKVERLGGYVCHSSDPVGGERLYRWAVHQELVARGEWGDLPFGRRQAFEIFAATVRASYLPLKAEQARLAAAGAEPPHQLGLALEDSIFEPEDSLGKLRPEAVAAAPMIASYDRGAPTRAREQAEAAKQAEPAKPLSVGEAPPAPPVNRGGRGHRKAR